MADQVDRDVRSRWRSEATHALAAIAGVGAITAGSFSWLHVTNPTTVALSLLLLVLFVAASSRLWVAMLTSVAAALSLDFFFLPPALTLNINDPQDWIAFVAFVVVSLVASQLSAAARGREQELSRLFDFSRDVLLSTDSSDAIRALAHRISQRFRIGYVAICLSTDAGFDRHEAGTLDAVSALNAEDLRRVVGGSEQELGPVRQHREGARDEVETKTSERHPLRLVPLRRPTHVIGVLAVADRSIGSTTLNALASVVAIAIERVHLLEQRKQAEISERGVELKSALLGSLAHDLRTPLTAIRTAVNNLSMSSLTDVQRAGQVNVATTGLDRLARRFENMLDMSRIDVGAIVPSLRWVQPSEIVQAARSHVEQALHAHRIEMVDRSLERAVHVDPRLLAAALAHLLENAAQYSPSGSTITVTHDVTADGLLMSVDDEGSGIGAADAPHLFERFYRGAEAHRHASGTGMGLAIVQGLLVAHGGRVWAEDRTGGGATFSIFVPAKSRVAIQD